MSQPEIKQEHFGTIRLTVTESNNGYLHLHSNVIC